MRWVRRGWLVGWLVGVIAGGYAQAVVKFARYPAPSPDGTQLVFSYQGDLWLAPLTGGQAQRLTVHEGYDFAPVWSPDGKKIAFTSDRYGNDDVFVLYLDTGRIQRLTWFSGTDRTLGWTPDSQAVIFESQRDWEPYGVRSVPYVAPLSGGTPYRLHDVEGTPAALAPDGKQVAFVRRHSAWWRKGYRGSATGDLWLHQLDSNRFVRLTDTDTPDTFPMWAPDGRTLYFVSERDGTYNLYAMEVATRRVRPLTRFKEDGVRFPQISANGRVIVFEQGMDIWRLELPSGNLQPIALTIPADDERGMPEVVRTFTGNISEYAVAPSGKEVAFVVRGEIFATRFPDGGITRNLTETVEPESGLTWSPDSKVLIFSAEREGQSDLYRLTSDDPEEPRLRRARKLRLEPLTQTPDSETSPRLSPDGKKLAFRRGAGDLVVMDIETRQERVLVKGWNLGDFLWSPDSRWLAYEQADENYNSDIWIVSAEGGEPVNLTRHPRNDSSPSWSADGRALVFLSERDTDTPNIYFVYLRKEDDEKTRADREDEEDARHDAPGKEEKMEQKPPQVQIDFEDIHLRIRAVTRYADGVQEAVVSPDAERIAYRTAYQGQSDLYTIKWDGTDEKRLTTGGMNPTQIAWSSDGKTLYFLSRGRLQRVAATGGTPQATSTEVQIRIRPDAERAYLLDAVWRTLNETFYDPNFHGVNWSAMRTKYRPYLPYARAERDFTVLVYLMLGELRSSHVSFSPAQGDSEEGGQPTGMLGVVWSNRRDGEGLLIERVLPNTPAARREVNLQPGERVLTIDGQRITPTTNVWRLLEGKVDKRVELLVRQPDGKERTVYLRPISISEYSNARYRDWVQRNRRYVEQKSGGRLGYVHIQAMGEQSLREFIRDLYAAAYGKQGLVIDVRFNGGGRTADYLLAILHVPRHAYTVGRGGKPGYPHDRLPVPEWTKPIAVLCNYASFSNAEIFAHAIKTLRRGPLIGTPTAGGVISTGQRTLMDGSRVSTPGRGWYTIDKGINLEGNGAQPDHLVEDMPDDLAAGRDRQLDKAIEVLLERAR